jgi:colanic acid/amylovoran biosynthesis protein
MLHENEISCLVVQRSHKFGKLYSNTERNVKVTLLGATFETTNMGVSALTAGTINCIIHNDPEAEITLLDYGKERKTYKYRTQNKEITIQLLNMRFSKKIYLSNNIALLILLSLLIKLVPTRKLKARLISGNPFLNHIYQSDVVASIAGGDSFSDIYGLGRLFYAALPQMLVLFLNKKLIQLPQTIGPFKSMTARFIARYILNHSSIIYSRDYIGLKETKELMHKKDVSGKLMFCHDVGFVVIPAAPEKMDLDGLPATNEGKYDVVGLNVSGLLFMGGYTKQNMFGLKSDYKEFVYDLIDFLIKEKKLTVLLVPHVFGYGGRNSESDSIVCDNIYAELKPKYQDRLFLVRGSYNQSEIKYIIGGCDFFIGSRMHACIAALSQCIPAVGIAYSQKFKGVFETIGVENLVADPRMMGKDEIFKIINNALEDRKKTREMLQKLMPEVRQEILGIFNNIE